MSLISFPAVRIRIVTVTLAIVCLASSLYGESISGTIQSGGTVSSVPLRNITVTLFEATTGSPNRIAQTKSDARGRFLITCSKDSSESIFFLSAQVDIGVQFLAVIGPSLPSTVTMNELTTVAASAEALANLARDPARNVRLVSLLAKLSSSYAPALIAAPDAWTVTVKVNDSGDDGNLIGGPGNLVFDADGYAWITNNVVQGTTKSSKTMIVLKPNGQASDGSYGKPKSPVTGGGLLGGGYGITIDRRGFVWEGNFGWGGVNPTTPHGNGSISEFSPFGVPISGPEG